MKLALSSFLCSRAQSTYQSVLIRLFSSSSARTSSSGRRLGGLFDRISPLGDPGVSVVPVLDQWVQQGLTVKRENLQEIIKVLASFKRYAHALEISQWMTDKRFIPPTQTDFAIRLNLIFRVHGLEQAESYFSNIPLKLRNHGVYIALLNCYAHARAMEKAESIMQNLREMSMNKTTLSFNIMMGLYFVMGSFNKLDDCMHEMEESGVGWDFYTLTIRLKAYAAASDIEGMDNLILRVESDPHIVLDYKFYAIAAQGYLKMGLLENALAMLKKLEGEIATSKKRTEAFPCLLGLCADAGKKGELYRIWNSYKEKVNAFNRNYMHMMYALVKLDDIEGAEKILEEWELSCRSYDFRVPNHLIDAYCRRGLLEKAEALIDKGMARGGGPIFYTWYSIAGAYLEDDQITKAVETLKKAITVHKPTLKPSKDTMLTCLEYLEGKGDLSQADEFVKLLRTEGVFSAVAHDRLLNYIKDRK